MTREPQKVSSDGHLECRVLSPSELTAVDRQQMYGLMTDHYENVEWADFDRDLSDKEWVIITLHPDRGILGFTTLMRLEAVSGDEQLVALFSGDTVLDPDIWGASGWARAWGRLATSIMRQHDNPLYWLLLTATHRTYRFLPTFLKEYYPRPDLPTPLLFQRRMDALVAQRFPDAYDSSRGIIRTNRPLAVRQQRVSLSVVGREDPHSAYFAKMNPGYLQGDYLVCLGDLSFDNRTRLGHKFFALDDA